MDVYLTLRAAPQLEKPDRPRSASAPPRVAPCLLPPVSGPQSDRETLQRCPATAARLSTFCPTRHWSMLWQVQWWAEMKHRKKQKKQKTKCHDCTSNFSWPCLASLMLAALVFKLAYKQTENGEWAFCLLCFCTFSCQYLYEAFFFQGSVTAMTVFFPLDTAKSRLQGELEVLSSRAEVTR